MADDASASRQVGGRARPAPIAAVHVSRTFAAPRELVFRAWTEAEAVSQWFAPPWLAPHVEADLRVGGRYRITLRVPPTRRKAHVVGTFLEVAPPERLVYTFTWERLPVPAFGMGDSTVTVEFREVGGATEVRLTHELLAKRRLRAFHRRGWERGMGRLARILERGSVAGLTEARAAGPRLNV
jgi:uncharacterized protein YndB with AHSA1/START domain